MDILKEIFKKLLDYFSLRQLVVFLSSILVVMFIAWRLDRLWAGTFEEFIYKIIYLAVIVLIINLGYYLLEKLVKQKEAVKTQKARRNKFYANMHEKVKDIQMALNRDAQKVELKDYFVPPFFKLAASDVTYLTGGESFDFRSALKRAVIEKQQSGIVIIGSGGAGKTVIAQWVTEQVNQPRTWSFLVRNVKRKEKQYDELSFLEKIEYLFHKFLVYLELETDSDFETFPYAVFVSLPQFMHSTFSDLDGEELIVAYLRKSIRSDDIFTGREKRAKKQGVGLDGLDDWLDQGLILPVFDGLDSLSPEEQKRFLAGLKNFTYTYNKCGPFILTVRETDLNVSEFNDLNISLWDIQPFNHLQIVNYLEKVEKDKDKVSDLWNSIASAADRNPQLWTIIATPLLLGMLVNTFILNENINLPGKWGRQKIYKLYFEWLWDRVNQKTFKAAKPNFPRSMLAKLAYQSLKAGEAIFSIFDLDKTIVGLLDNLILKKIGNDQYSFLHASFQSYFAADYIFQTNSDIDFHVIRQKILGGFSSQNPDEQIDIRNSSQWQDTLIFLIERFSEESNICPDFIGDIVKELYEPKLPLSSKVLLLRLVGVFCPKKVMDDHGLEEPSLSPIRGKSLIKGFDLTKSSEARETEIIPAWFVEKKSSALLNIIKKIGFENVSEEQMAENSVEWLMNFLKSSTGTSGWQVGFAEAGYGLSTLAWEKLKLKACDSALSNRDLAIHVMACLHHVKSADFIVEYACRDVHSISDYALNELSRMGLLLVNPIVDAYNHAKSKKLIQSQLNLIILMKSVVPSRQLLEILHKSIQNSSQNNLLAKEAVLTLAGNGDFNSANAQLISYFNKADENIGAALIFVLTKMPLNDKAQEKLVDLLGSWSKSRDRNRRLQRDMAIKILQGKLKSMDRNAQTRELEALIDHKLRSFRPDGIGRKLLGFLLKNKSLNWLHKVARKLSHPNRDFLESLLDICAKLDSDKAKQWVVLLLTDSGLELREKAKNVFCEINHRMKDRTEWLEQIRKEKPFPTDVANILMRRIERNENC